MPLVLAAGFVSFISPCILPLVPGYLSTVSGVSFEELQERGPGIGRRVAVASALFFAGFLTVFVALGASASVVGALLDDGRGWLDRISGVLILLFGLSLLAGRWSQRVGARLGGAAQDAARRRGGPVVLGVAFAFCWTPCVGPILASILALSAASASLKSGVLLLALYGLGLAAPFLLVGFGFTRSLAAFKRLQRHYAALQATAGVLLVVTGALLASGYLYLLNVYAQRVLRALGLDWWTTL